MSKKPFSFGDVSTSYQRRKGVVADEEPEWVKDSPEEAIERATREMLMRPSKRNFDDYYHPSRIYDMCPVAEFWLRIRKPPFLIEEPQLALSMMAAAGTKAHDFFQNEVFGPSNLLWGTWECTNCGAEYEKTLMPPMCTDEYCGCNRLQFIEPAILNHEHKIRGHADGRILIPNTEDLIMMEMKSKSAKAYPGYNKPSKKERVQGSIYMDCLGMDECVYVFICRDDYRYKVVIEEKKEDLVDQAYHMIHSIEDCVAAGEPDPVLMCQRKCGSPKTTRAHACPFRLECWSYDE